MSLQIITIDESEKWDNIVRSFKAYDVYYLSGYVKAFWLHGDGEPQLFYYDQDGTRAVNVVMKRDIAKDKNFNGKMKEGIYFDLITPYGYGGFLVEGDDVEALNQAYSAYCCQANIISEFVRFHPVIGNADKMKTMYDIVELGNTVYMDTTSKEVIWNNISSKNRNTIRKAQKSGVEIFWGRDKELIDSFIQIYNATMDKDNAADYYYFDRTFYNSIVEDLGQHSLFFYAKKDNEIIGMSIILFCNGQVHYHLSGSKREFQSCAPTNLLLYTVACWASERGYKTLHLGGGLGARQDGLYRFKKSFNRIGDRIFAVGRKIMNEEIYKELVAESGKEAEIDKNTTFFPLYRL